MDVPGLAQHGKSENTGGRRVALWLVGRSCIHLHIIFPVQAPKRRDSTRYLHPHRQRLLRNKTNGRPDQKWLSRSISAFVVLASLVDATPVPRPPLHVFRSCVAIFSNPHPPNLQDTPTTAYPSTHLVTMSCCPACLLVPGCQAARTMEAPGKLAASVATLLVPADRPSTFLLPRI